MNIDNLLTKFIHAKNNFSYDNYDFFECINTISDYVMYEQSIIKKNNINSCLSNITYTYDTMSYDAINDLYNSINFISEPIIGSSKSVIVNGCSDTSLPNKIYILDKIKDSLMHLEGNNTKYIFSEDNKSVIIKNIMSDYSLECEIRISDLRYFCDLIKSYYVNVDNELELIDYMRLLHKSGNDIVNKDNGVFKITSIEDSPEKIYSYTNKKGVFKRLESDYLSYHTYSYITLLKSETKDDYPILPSLYSSDVFCENNSYKEQCQSILNTMDSKYKSLTSNALNKHIPYKNKVDQAINFLDYTIKSIGNLNGQIVRSLRNARAHANKASNEDCDIYFFDVEDNTTITNDFKFALRIQKPKLISLLNEINYCPTSNDYINILHNEINTKDFEYLYEYIEYLNTFIYHCALNGYDTKDLLNNLSEYGNVLGVLSDILMQDPRLLARR